MKRRGRNDQVFREGTGARTEQSSSRRRPVRPPERQRIARGRGRLVINAFIVWHLFSLWIWQIPGSAIYDICIPFVRPYMTFTGLRQGWGVFSPNPGTLDVYVEARITYADGRVRSWIYPRMVDMGYWERYRRERFRKLIEFGHLEAYPMVWPSLARYAARRNNVDLHNPPVAVELIRHFRYVQPPGHPMTPYQTYTFFREPIAPKELR